MEKKKTVARGKGCIQEDEARPRRTLERASIAFLIERAQLLEPESINNIDDNLRGIVVSLLSLLGRRVGSSKFYTSPVSNFGYNV